MPGVCSNLSANHPRRSISIVFDGGLQGSTSGFPTCTHLPKSQYSEWMRLAYWKSGSSNTTIFRTTRVTSGWKLPMNLCRVYGSVQLCDDGGFGDTVTRSHH